MRLFHRSIVFATFALAAMPAVAGDFTKWAQPSQPQWCHFEVERLYQTADLQPLHVVLVNRGLGDMQILFEARAAGRYRPLILGSAKLTVPAGARRDIVLSKRLDVKDTTGGFDLAIKECN